MNDVRQPNDGVSLAAIVAKETTVGKWSGSGGGIGLGFNGFGLFYGGMSGSKRDQTQRAKDFSVLTKTNYSTLKVWTTPLYLFGIALVFKVITLFMGSVEQLTDRDNSSPMDRVGLLAGEFSNILGTYVPLICIFGFILWFIFGYRAADERENKRVERQRENESRAETIYMRLRYIENDHIVFDPLTKKEVPASSDKIRELIFSLTGNEKDA
ncbi:TPA: hypothetical protein R4Z46_004513 [Escherichia coli]|nr:hypothetical protein [Escherichia coli]HED2730979.1 hypothetical protein [Escherichia coli]